MRWSNPQFTGRKSHACKEVTQRSHTESRTELGWECLPWYHSLSLSPQALCSAHPTQVLSDLRQGTRQAARGRDFLSRPKGQTTQSNLCVTKTLTKSLKLPRTTRFSNFAVDEKLAIWQAWVASKENDSKKGLKEYFRKIRQCETQGEWQNPISWPEW